MKNGRKAFGNVSIICAIAGLLWFIISFSAPEAKWWNSLWFFFVIFLVALSFGIFGRNTIKGIIGIVLGGIGFLAVSLLMYVG